MTSRRLSGLIVALTLGIAAACTDPVSQGREASSATRPRSVGDAALGAQDGNHIAVRDDCDPRDPAWAPSGGCVEEHGRVRNREFTEFLSSRLSAAVVGHPAWRNEPSYLKITVGEAVSVTNEGGRLHTFTEVQVFGGGRVPPLRMGLTPAPECDLAAGAVDPTELPPGASLTISGLTTGTHSFQCCIHPWMRAAIKVLPPEEAAGTAQP